MPANQFLPFGTGVGSNVLAQASYAALTARTAGFASGIAPSSHVNKALRQGAFMSAVVGEFILGQLAADVPDDGDLAARVAQFVAALNKLTGKTAPLYGLHAMPAATMTIPNDVSTDITSFGTVANGLLASTFSGGIFTVGTGDNGFYLLTDWLGTNLGLGSTGYGFAGTIGLSTNGGSSYTSIGGQTGYSNSSGVLGPFFGCSVVQKLNVGDKVKLSMRQNIGSSQNAPCGFGAIFLGK